MGRTVGKLQGKKKLSTEEWARGVDNTFLIHGGARRDTEKGRGTAGEGREGGVGVSEWRRVSVRRSLGTPGTTTALVLAEDRKSKKRRRSDCAEAVHTVPLLFQMRFRNHVVSGKTANP